MKNTNKMIRRIVRKTRNVVEYAIAALPVCMFFGGMLGVGAGIDPEVTNWALVIPSAITMLAGCGIIAILVNAYSYSEDDDYEV